MRVLTVRSTELRTSARLDAHLHLSEGKRIATRLRGSTLTLCSLGGTGGLGHAWMPNRWKKVEAVQDEARAPYLRPYDVFGYIPRPSDYVSVPRNKKLEQYRIQDGIILITRSGRNLGPAGYVDRYLAQFVLSDDMIRLQIADERLRFYVLGCLATQTMQELLRRDKSGSVIDHLTPEHVASQQVPLLDDAAIDKVSQLMRQAVSRREEARLGLTSRQTTYEASLPSLPSVGQLREGWTARSAALARRLDAAPVQPRVTQVRQSLLAAGGRRLRDLADVLKPEGRYKTNYVGRGYGLPILSGGQLLEFRPINLRFIAIQALDDPDRYKLKAGWLAFPADGRAEEGLGEPIVITRDRHDWLASGHVGRIVPKADVVPGLLYMALRADHVQLQIKALACGSVVDATYPGDVGGIVLPPLPELPREEVTDLWDKFSDAEELEAQAIRILEVGLMQATKLLPD